MKKEKSYRIEVIEEPYMNNSLFLTQKGAPYIFKEHYSESYIMDEICDAFLDYRIGDEYEYKIYTSRKNPSIIYVISETSERPYADNHDVAKASALLKKSAKVMESPQTNKGFKTFAPSKKSGIAQLENSMRKML